MDEQAALVVCDLKYRYPGARKDGVEWVVDVPRLELAKGEQVLLTGGSGSGKSTLLHTIAGLHDPAQGRVEIGGRAIHSLRGAKRDRFRGESIGMIFQTFNLLHGFSARENVMAAMMFSRVPAREHRGRADALLGHLGVDEASKEVGQFSVGQQQRIAVARALACDPVLVLADEPTASLDPENGQVAIGLIQDLCREKGAALLCTSHDPSLAARFERRASLDELRGEGE